MPSPPAPPLARDAFDLDPEVVWVMHCAEGPVPRSAAEQVRTFLGRETRPWTVRWEEDFQGLPRRVRREAARLLGGSPDGFSLVPTTTGGLTVIAQGYPWKAGDEVLAPLGEFPANAWPWKSLEGREVSFREVPLWAGHRAGATAWDSAPPPPDVEPEAALLEAIGARTRLLSVSWVRFQDGLRLDLERLARGCRERGVELVVDGIQGAGTASLDLAALEGVGAFATGGHKGLLAPQGLGLLWTAPELRRRLSPPGGWLSVEEATDFTRPSTDLERGWAAGGERLELGVPNLLGCAALGESLAVLADAGAEAIAAHIERLQERLLERLAAAPGWASEARRLAALGQRQRLGSILSLHHGGRGRAALGELLRSGGERGILASVREGYLRIALHGWHTADDVDAVAAWLEATPG